MAESIQVIVPNYEEDAEANEAAFWAAVDADPKMVVVVAAVHESEDDAGSTAAFSTYTLALEHAKAVRCAGAIIIPLRLDEPAWGNVSVN